MCEKTQWNMFLQTLITLIHILVFTKIRAMGSVPWKICQNYDHYVKFCWCLCVLTVVYRDHHVIDEMLCSSKQCTRKCWDNKPFC